MNVREAALISLVRCGDGNKFSNLEVDSAIKKYGFDGSDRAFFTALVYGVIEKQITLDYVLSKFVSKPLDKIEPKIVQILRLGAYQILFLDRVPDSAACNESVELAKQYTHKGTSGFVNGVLRNIARNKSSIEYPPKNTTEYYSVKYSCPVWLCKMWRDMYGDEICERSLEGVNRNPRITLRTNTLKTSRDGLIEALRTLGISCEPTALSPYGITLSEFIPTADITPIADGLCFVQDESSQLCAYAAGAKAGDTVIDVCSCPGGKSFGMAMDMVNEGKIFSFDLHESKLSLVDSGSKRLGIDIIVTGVQNGSVRRNDLDGTADVVLCDVPCSGLGVIAKKPDLRHKSPEDIEKLPPIQYSILDNASNYVKPGGTLVYSTCTVNVKENEEVAEKFLASHPDFSPCSDRMPFSKPMITLFPGEHGTDGFFIAKFRKNRVV